jgi:hypothetical protein
MVGGTRETSGIQNIGLARLAYSGTQRSPVGTSGLRAFDLLRPNPDAPMQGPQRYASAGATLGRPLA